MVKKLKHSELLVAVKNVKGGDEDSNCSEVVVAVAAASNVGENSAKSTSI